MKATNQAATEKFYAPFQGVPRRCQKWITKHDGKPYQCNKRHQHRAQCKYTISILIQ